MRTPDWICHDSTAVCLSVMSTPHIFNVLTYLRTGTGPHGPMLRGECSGFTNAEWFRLLEAELLLRSRRMQGPA